MKDSLMTSFVSEVRSPAHISFDDQFVGVERWIKRNSAPGTQLSAIEIFNVIRYVVLYEEEDETTSHRKVPLKCPYCSDKAAWTAEIRGQEMSRIVKHLHTETPSTTTRRIFTVRQNSGWSVDDLEDDSEEDLEESMS
eukprot:CAMPEP_0114418506 /NCGR_PEP_ID=MMETSP0103-20121206/3533_1 /TAXON_ID=37642 ORGANISM="Paraphysomonas imperforata, Strain PA2" /NCGR_SAMPLE_ID=MMETSP0103 /ASSEMBLY_ACC=CAM_ASM_000201 /LENGTH=137 /DNA_ID=CAMNT_0001586869 /DNA_START=98 /DNA_END=511 /DNA_ORIENTATION=-